MWYQWNRKIIEEEIVYDIKHHNPNEIFDKYFNKFKELHLHKSEIKVGDVFCRGRKGYLGISGAIDDCNTVFSYPYYGKEIGAPPPINTMGGRFNRDGYSYLYLTSDEKTCAAEIHIEVNQICSIAKFECIKSGDYLRLIPDPNYQNEYEMILYDILTQPIHDEIKYKYYITQLFSDIIKQLDYRGIYFKSTQSDGCNVVCFYPKDFKYIDFSERMFRATNIQYTIEEVQESYKDYSDYRRLMNSYNSDETDIREKQFEHIVERIEADDQEEFSRLRKEAESEIHPAKKAQKYNRLVKFTIDVPEFYREAHLLRGIYRIKEGQINSKSIEDLIIGHSASSPDNTIQKTITYIKEEQLMSEIADSEIESIVKETFSKMERRKKRKTKEMLKAISKLNEEAIRQKAADLKHQDAK